MIKMHVRSVSKVFYSIIAINVVGFYLKETKGFTYTDKNEKKNKRKKKNLK